MVDPDNAVSLADAIYSLWKDPERAAELGRRGAEAVRKYFSAAHMAARAVEAFQVIAHA
jgi:glycosyltransferase involved in cell wall biosynthesis